MKKIILAGYLVFNILVINCEDNDSNLIAHVKQSIASAEQLNSKLTADILNISGMSSPKVRHFLNNLCSLPDARYLEIGVWRGSTFISALYGNIKTINKAIAIDQWKDLNVPGLGNQKQFFLANTAKFIPSQSFKLCEQDSFAIIPKDICQDSINIYFYDGDHRESSQYQAFMHYNIILAQRFIAIVDDWNHPSVKAGTRRAFKDLKYKVLFEAELPSNYNGDIDNWWNGLYVAVIEKI